ncbi:hypothetical protein B0T20DRAFT_392396 [Sordaria brevicollis]|uniref:Helicase C-terminal domain-containing protein n=1 Tax=Sordaria brevicollis TaxID=83679 RepID=A0AAE0UD51_SORBR|nr:hypothetical protein B0T20DRAFT_392396 [Sordaria brevicollis]
MREEARLTCVLAENPVGQYLHVLILNCAVNAAGLNLHHQCHIGVGLNFVWIINTMLQYMGRLYRVGKQNVVEWWLPTVHGTICDWNEERILRKWIHELVPTLDLAAKGIPKEAGQYFRTLAGYEAAKYLLSQDSNRFAWVAEAPQSNSDYYFALAVLAGSTGLRTERISTPPLKEEMERADGTHDEALTIVKTARNLWAQTTTGVIDSGLSDEITNELGRMVAKAEVVSRMLEMGYKAVVVWWRFLEAVR